MGQNEIRKYAVHAESTELFGRVQCAAREHRFIVDGPVHNGCPGEAITPAEVFLSGVAACGVELVQVIAKEQQLTLTSVSVEIEGSIDKSNPVRRDVTVFNSVRIDFMIGGVEQEKGLELVGQFRGR